MSLWLSSPEIEKQNKPKTQKPKWKKEQGSRIRSKKCLCLCVCAVVCACRASLTFVRSLTPEQVQKKCHPAVLARHPLCRHVGGVRARAAASADASHGRDVFMSNVEMVSFTFCVRNRKIGYKILRACAWSQTQTQTRARPRLECSAFCSPFDDDIGGCCCCGCHTNLSCACIWSRRKF